MHNDEDSVSDFIREIWQGRRFVVAGLLVGGLLAFAFLSFATPHYKGEMVLAPADPLELSQSASLTQIYGPANAPSGAADSASNFQRYEALYTGAAVAGLLLRDPEITDGLSQDRLMRFSKTEQDWSAEKLSEYIKERVYVDPVGETALRAYVYHHPDPVFAKTFLSRIHNIADGLIRHAVRKSVNERIAYINGAMSEIYNPDHRRAMTDLLMEQERIKMLVSIDQPYAANVVVEASSSSKPAWPDAALVYPAFILIGGLIGFFVFSVSVSREDGLLAGFKKVKQQEWFFPESGNNNEKPKEKPLTGKKAGQKKPKKHKKPKGSGKDIPSEAAE